MPWWGWVLIGVWVFGGALGYALCAAAARGDRMSYEARRTTMPDDLLTDLVALTSSLPAMQRRLSNDYAQGRHDAFCYMRTQLTALLAKHAPKADREADEPLVPMKTEVIGTVAFKPLKPAAPDPRTMVGDYRVHCSTCGKPVSSALGVEPIVRAYVERPECIEAKAATEPKADEATP